MTNKLVFVALLSLLLALLLSASASAGSFHLYVCGYGNPTTAPMSEVWWSGAWAQSKQTSCGDRAALNVAWNSSNAIPNLAFGQAGAAGQQIAAPAGTYFSGLQMSTNVRSQGGGGRCAGAFRGDGSLINGSQNCRSNAFSLASTGYLNRNVSNIKTDRLYLLAFCSYGPCGGSPSVFSADFDNITLRLNDSTWPEISSPTGLATQSSWVHGKWPVGFTASDGLGIRQNLLLVGSLQSGNSVLCTVKRSSSGYYWGYSFDLCPTSTTANFNLDTNTIASGKRTLTMKTVDLTGNFRWTAKQIFIDNTPPVISSLTTTSPKTDNTPLIDIKASDSLSSLSAYYCKIDGGLYQTCSAKFTAPPLTNGRHQICVKVANNSRNASGAALESAERCLNVTVESSPSSPQPTPDQPTAEPGSFASDSNSGDGMIVAAPRVRTDGRSVTLSTTVTLAKPGTISQTVINRYGKRRLRCSAVEDGGEAGENTLECRMGKATRKALRKTGMTFLATTIVVYDDGSGASEVDSFSLRRRP